MMKTQNFTSEGKKQPPAARAAGEKSGVRKAQLTADMMLPPNRSERADDDPDAASPSEASV